MESSRSTSSLSVRAPSCGAHASRPRTDSFSSVRALSCSARATPLYGPAPTRCARAPRSPPVPAAGAPYDSLPQMPFPRSPVGDPKRRAAEHARASVVQGGPGKVAGRGRTESPQPASSRARRERPPAANPERARTRTARPLAATGHASLSDPRGPRIRHGWPSFRCPSAQRSFATRGHRIDSTWHIHARSTRRVWRSRHLRRVGHELRFGRSVLDGWGVRVDAHVADGVRERVSLIDCGEGGGRWQEPGFTDPHSSAPGAGRQDVAGVKRAPDAREGVACVH